MLGTTSQRYPYKERSHRCRSNGSAKQMTHFERRCRAWRLEGWVLWTPTISLCRLSIPILTTQPCMATTLSAMRVGGKSQGRTQTAQILIGLLLVSTRMLDVSVPRSRRNHLTRLQQSRSGPKKRQKQYSSLIFRHVYCGQADGSCVSTPCATSAAGTNFLGACQGPIDRHHRTISLPCR